MTVQSRPGQPYRSVPRALPGGLEGLNLLATDLRWTWSHAGDALWESVDRPVWDQIRNPYVVLQNVTERRLAELARDPQFKARLNELTDAREAYLTRSCWCAERVPPGQLGGVAYFSLEFGLGEALPLYAGGLGILAGDHLKAASDLGVPLVGVGLLYHEGYFRQTLDAYGRQRETYPYNDPTSLPVTPVLAENGAWLNVPLEFPGRTLRFRVWQAAVGRTTLYLLDSNDPLNLPSDRGITGKLYPADPAMRLMQEIALGIGGWRLLRSLGLEVDVCHINEGHAGFATLERAHQFMGDHGVDFWQALWATRAGNVFTTHTSVAAAFDTFPQALAGELAAEYAERLGISLRALLALGRLNPDDDHEPFNMTYLAARTSGSINGVSRIHGAVSRRILAPLYPGRPEAEIPVTHVTNGVHVPSWDSAGADALWTGAGGKDRWLGDLDSLGEAIESLSDERLWRTRNEERAEFVADVRIRLARQLRQCGAGPRAVDEAGTVLDPQALTLGFARRFTAYKRPNLLLVDEPRFAAILAHPDRPVQIVVAGKAHPADDDGKRFIRQWLEFIDRAGLRSRAVFLEDYDIALAQQLVQGVDLWVNTPRRPWEACGTSGMKVLVNGGLNLSELDGWWQEAYAPDVGWTLSDAAADRGDDAAQARSLYRRLEEEIVPAFYERDGGDIPPAWVARMRISMARLAPHYSSNRMLREYVERLYCPAAAAYARRSANGSRRARELREWEIVVRRHWPELRFGELAAGRSADGWSFELEVALGNMPSDFIRVQLYADGEGEGPAEVVEMGRHPGAASAAGARRYLASVKTARPASHYTPRIVAFHPECVPSEAGATAWYQGAAVVDSS